MMPSRMKNVLRAGLLVAGAGLAIAAAPRHPAAAVAQPRAAKLGAAANWSAQIAVTDDGSHRIGKPDAPVRLTEYVSYTCPHCAHLVKESTPVLRAGPIPKGQVAVTVTNLLRNPIDLTIAMLVNCGDPRRFFVRHEAFFAAQDTWMAKAEATTHDQQARWYQGEMPARMRAMSEDLGFYAMMQGWGITHAQTDACLANPATLAKLKQQQVEVGQLGLQGTPSFVLNGETLDAHDWDSVYKLINDKLAAQRTGTI